MLSTIPTIRPFDLTELEIERLERGDMFITLIRPVDEGQNSPVRCEDTLWGKENHGKSKYPLRVISTLKNFDKWIIVVNRQYIQRPDFLSGINLKNKTVQM